ncbi:hypothetical protein DL239_20235 [Sedimentitalea sp. CY04]|uniref:Uncharacterized protein n=1 Tax=Parasedimentitalea denitrificans TaxID=2211118 RepID=A0ABX0WG13_9RHOB|nr:hypothetical protein [Sedimentitalea sp. CY04]NIZ63300.1 hypothetical protein [Sedimentitalea sp. CY04]
MNTEDQAAGEKRVQDVLIKPLLDLGLAKPSTLTKARFDDMLKELRQMLAYMTAENLDLLRQEVEVRPGGKDGDRFPIALKIRKWARDIQQPVSGPSPLMIEVFTHQLGRDALEKGWAPELMINLRGARKWPGPFTVSGIKAAADDAMRRLEDIELRLSRNEEIQEEDAMFRNKRRAAIQKCQDIADQSQARGAA